MTVHILKLNNNIKRTAKCIITEESADSKAYLDAVMEMVIYFLCLIKIKTIAKEKCLSLGVNTQLFVVGNYLFAPFNGISAVMANSCIASSLKLIKIHKEKVCAESVCESCSIVALILIKPLFHRHLVRISKCHTRHTLIHLNVFMSVCANRLTTILHSKIYIRSANTMTGFKKFGHHIVLPFAAKSSSRTELCEVEGIYGTRITNRAIRFIACKSNKFVVKSFSSRTYQIKIIILHTIIYFTNNFKKIYFKLHYTKERTFNFKTESSVRIAVAFNILADRMPEAQELNIIGLNDAERAEVVQFFVCKAKSAEVVDLGVYLIYHFLSKYYILISTLKKVNTIKICVLMEHYLIHIKLIEVGVEKRYNNRAKFHHFNLIPFVF